MLESIFFSLFLFYGMDCPHSSALICRREAKGNWGALVVLWHQTAELRSTWISDWVLPRQNGHFKWSCGFQWQSTERLPTEGWPSKMLVYLYISVYAECVHCTIFRGGEGGGVKGARGNRVMKNILCKTHILGLHIWDLDTDFQRENLPRDTQRSLPPT